MKNHDDIGKICMMRWKINKKMKNNNKFIKILYNVFSGNFHENFREKIISSLRCKWGKCWKQVYFLYRLFWILSIWYVHNFPIDGKLTFFFLLFFLVLLYLLFLFCENIKIHDKISHFQIFLAICVLCRKIYRGKGLPAHRHSPP